MQARKVQHHVIATQILYIKQMNTSKNPVNCMESVLVKTSSFLSKPFANKQILLKDNYR